MKHSWTKLLIFIILITLSGCEERESPNKETLPMMDTLRGLYEIFHDGEIDQAILNNEIVFGASYNAYDAAAIIFDITGRIIGECDYAWGPIDTICYQITDIEVIYRYKHHISGLRPVDKYHLGD
jgi:hypothetical protein